MPTHENRRTIVCCMFALVLFLVPGAAHRLDAQTSPQTPAPSPPDSRMEIYGKVQTDFGFDLNQIDPNWFDVLRPTRLPSFQNEFGRDGRTFASVRQTRFGVKAYQPTSLGELFAIFEWELFGVGVDAGQTTFRLRHAYGEIGQFGAGQYWSPFMDIDVFPNSLEYWGPNGMVFFRNVQVRWMPIKGDTRLTFALERPGSTQDPGVLQDRVEIEDISSRFPYPDLSGEFRLGGDWGYVEAAGMLRKIVLDDESVLFNLDDHVIGWGANFSSNINVGSEDVIKLQYAFGEAVQNYLNDGGPDVAAVPNLDPDRPLRAEGIPVRALVAFYDHYWSDRWSTSLGYSQVDVDNTVLQTPDAFRRGQYALINLLHYPVEDVMVGGELQWGRRSNFSDGFRSNDYKVQFSFQFNFDATVAR